VSGAQRGRSLRPYWPVGYFLIWYCYVYSGLFSVGVYLLFGLRVSGGKRGRSPRPYSLLSGPKPPLFLPGGSSVVLPGLDGPRSRLSTSRSVWWRQGVEPEPLGLWPGALSARPQRQSWMASCIAISALQLYRLSAFSFLINHLTVEHRVSDETNVNELRGVEPLFKSQWYVDQDSRE
jgi:hypothetical protein